LSTCSSVSEKAFKEWEIENLLKNMAEQWETIEFDIKPHGQTFIIAAFEEINNFLDDHLSKTQNLQIHQYREQFVQQIETWFNKMVLLSNILDEWSKFQKNWKYLAPIFDSADIAKQMP
jgi:dynein heavy chain